VLVLYAFVPPYAATVLEHASSFQRHSRFPVLMINTRLGFPPALAGLQFDAVVLHYSLFGTVPYELPDRFLEYLAESDAYTIAFFQDEYRFCRERFEFIDQFDLDVVYTLVEPRFWDELYRRQTRVRTFVHTLPGYVGDDLRAASARHARPDADRTVDIGYRARDLPFSLGAAARDKAAIGIEFARRARGLDLALDISVESADRLYARDWYAFLGNCRAVLGVEGGASAFDLDGSLREAEVRLRGREPEATYARYVEEAGGLLERIDYRTPSLMVTPRHFEAAAFGTCQILFDGTYSGVLEAGRHYIPLRKDFSNFDEAIASFRDPAVRAQVALAARRDLVDSGAFDYARLVESVDGKLADAGLQPTVVSGASKTAIERLRRDQGLRAVRAAGTRQLSRALGLARRGRRVLLRSRGRGPALA
jgi:hypothetical protein